MQGICNSENTADGLVTGRFDECPWLLVRDWKCHFDFTEKNRWKDVDKNGD